MFELIRTFNGIDFDVRFENKVNLFSGLSGEGKTFLFTVLEDYFMLNDINYQYYNSDSLRFGIRELISGCDGKKIIIPSSQKEINDIEFISYNEFQTNK